MLTPVSPLFPLATADWETNNSAPEQPSTAATTLSETEATVQAEAAADTEGGEPRAVQGLRELLSCLSLAKQLDCFGKHLASFIVPVAMAELCPLYTALHKRDLEASPIPPAPCTLAPHSCANLCCTPWRSVLSCPADALDGGPLQSQSDGYLSCILFLGLHYA